MIPLDPQLRLSAPGPVVALPTGGADRIEGDLVKALMAAGKIEARVLQVLNQTALIDFLDLGRAKVRTEVPLRAGDAFTALVEPQAEGAPGMETLKLRISELRHEPAAPLKSEHMAARLSEMNLPTDARHQAMATALLRHAGTLSRETLLQLNDALKQLAARAPLPAPAADPGAGQAAPAGETGQTRPMPTAGTAPTAAPPAASGNPSVSAQAAGLKPRILEAAAFLVAKGLPVTQESVAWAASRLSAQATPAERLAAIAQNPTALPPAAAQALVALGLPDDGNPAETAMHLAKLAEAFTAPEAKLARALTVAPAPAAPVTEPSAETPPAAAPTQETKATEPPRAEARASQPPETARPAGEARPAAEPLLRIREALTAVLERAVRSGEGSEPLREALSEVRFGQLMNASTTEPTQAGAERSLAMPLWWNGGSGEIRVQYRAKDGKRRAGGESAETRVVVTLDTTALQRVRIDLLLGRKQLNCQVVVEAEAVVELLRQRLPELQEALESTGLRVNALGVKHATAKQQVVATETLRQVDVWL